MSFARYAIYYTPPPSSPLARFGAAILGYDCFERHDVAQPPLGNLEPAMLGLATVAPRRYGFHATLVAPFSLDGSDEQELISAVDRFARAHAPVPVGALAVGTVQDFVALVAAAPDARIVELGAAC